jgi:hypothetical protein
MSWGTETEVRGQRPGTRCLSPPPLGSTEDKRESETDNPFSSVYMYSNIFTPRYYSEAMETIITLIIKQNRISPAMKLTGRNSL